MLLSLLFLGALAADPAPIDGVHRLRHVQHLELRQAHPYRWTAERPKVRQLTALVVEVEPELSIPRQVGAPVLFVGATPAELANVGSECACLIAVVPGHVDLARTPVYFGAPVLPERVDQARGNAELSAARAAGIQPFTATERDEAQAAPATVEDSIELYHLLADLIDAHAPQEAERAQNYRVPVLR